MKKSTSKFEKYMNRIGLIGAIIAAPILIWIIISFIDVNLHNGNGMGPQLPYNFFEMFVDYYNATH